MHNISETIAEAFYSVQTNNLFKLNAIWLNKPVLKGCGSKSVRIVIGDHLKIEEGKIIDCVGHSTHTVSAMVGTLNGMENFLTLKDITTGEELTLFIYN
jgi:predicted ABC-type transport system involved in lysophospholipase L1 biosynthesis ATPase subunit